MHPCTHLHTYAHYKSYPLRLVSCCSIRMYVVLHICLRGNPNDTTLWYKSSQLHQGPHSLYMTKTTREQHTSMYWNGLQTHADLCITANLVALSVCMCLSFPGKHSGWLPAVTTGREGELSSPQSSTAFSFFHCHIDDSSNITST